MVRLSTVPCVLALTLALSGSLGPAPVRADEFVDRANALIGRVPDSRRSDLILLPALAKMDTPPEAVHDKLGFALLDSTSPGWPTYLEWVNKPAQRAALEALAKITENNAHQRRMIFALPYGVEGVAPELVMEGQYIELGDPPTLAAAKFEYIERADWIAALAGVETNRLVAEGKPADALKVLVNTLFFARQIADRDSAFEKLFGMRAMWLTLELMRDVVYRDSRSGSPKLTPEVLAATIKSIAERDLLSIERIEFPEYERVAAEQLASKIFLPNGKINPATFAPTMSRVASGTRPLRLFSEAGRWDRIAARHKGSADTKTAIRNVANDFAKRWSLDAFDPYLSRPSDLGRMVTGKQDFSSLGPIFTAIPQLLDLRQRLRAEAAGTRMALGVQAYALRNKAFPPDFSAIRPAFVTEIDLDPYMPGQRRLSFFVPVRDQAGPGSDGSPHEIRVFQVPEYPNFSVRLSQDNFVIYSGGPDQSAEWVHDATQANPEYKAGDLLLWPPRMSLLRQYLTEQGLLE